jgi:UDP-glucose 4-epimerase
MQRHNCRQFVFSSTCATYGNPVFVPMDESHPQAPINPYGMSKLMLERVLLDCVNACGINHVMLRYFNASGCSDDAAIGEDHEPESHLIPRALMAVTGEVPALTVFGNDYPTPDGTCIRDYIHVLDLAQAHADQKIEQSKRAVEIETLRAEAEMEPLRAQAAELLETYKAGPEVLAAYLRNVRLSLYERAQQVFLEVSR